MDKLQKQAVEPEYTGGSVSYYKVRIENPVDENAAPYMAECQDIIEALEMPASDANVFKAVWRMNAARLGKQKKGYEDGVYDAEKMCFFSQRTLVREKRKREK